MYLNYHINVHNIEVKEIDNLLDYTFHRKYASITYISVGIQCTNSNFLELTNCPTPY